MWRITKQTCKGATLQEILLMCVMNVNERDHKAIAQELTYAPKL